MLAAITAEEDDQLQRGADAVERRMLGRRIENPAKTVADLRSALRRVGWVRIDLQWLGPGSMLVNAEIGARLQARLLRAGTISADRALFGGFVRAARKAGIRPGTEDAWLHASGRGIEASLGVVPLAALDAALDRMVDRWRKQRRAEQASARRATGVN